MNAAIGQAIQDGASDIHFVPQEDRVAVLARIDGMAHEIQSIPKQMQVGVISRLKIMGQLDIAERRLPQDGRVLVRLNGEPVDLRIAVLPTTHGERVVLRVLQRSTAGKSLADLGMSEDVQEEFERAIRQPTAPWSSAGRPGAARRRRSTPGSRCSTSRAASCSRSRTRSRTRWTGSRSSRSTRGTG